MKKRDHRALGRYVRAIADEMELRDWTLGLDTAPASPDKVATVEPVYGRKHATIRVCPEFRDMAAEDQRHAVVHELVHCHIEPALSMVRGDLENVAGPQTDRVFWEAFRRNAEYAVDGIAAAVAKHLPMIDWP